MGAQAAWSPTGRVDTDNQTMIDGGLGYGFLLIEATFSLRWESWNWLIALLRRVPMVALRSWGLHLMSAMVQHS